jgi:hypothetical protein
LVVEVDRLETPFPAERQGRWPEEEGALLHVGPLNLSFFVQGESKDHRALDPGDPREGRIGWRRGLMAEP